MSLGGTGKKTYGIISSIERKDAFGWVVWGHF